MQVDMGMEMVAAVRGVKVEEIYKLVDTHIQTVLSITKDLLSFWLKCIIWRNLLDNSCGTHTTLGFSSAMNKVVRMLEAEMKMDQVLKGFMVELDIDTKIPVWLDRL